jgi:hypothetical protein
LLGRLLKERRDPTQAELDAVKEAKYPRGEWLSETVEQKGEDGAADCVLLKRVITVNEQLLALVPDRVEALDEQEERKGIYLAGPYKGWSEIAAALGKARGTSDDNAVMAVVYLLGRDHANGEEVPDDAWTNAHVGLGYLPGNSDTAMYIDVQRNFIEKGFPSDWSRRRLFYTSQAFALLLP